jgi:hypothetical protein
MGTIGKTSNFFLSSSVAKFIVLDWGDKVKLRHRVVVPARQALRPVRRQPYARVDYISKTGTKNSASELKNQSWADLSGMSDR